MLLFLKEIEVLVHPVYDDFTFCPSCGEQCELVGMALHRGDCKLNMILAQPHPGQALLERMALLEALYEACQGGPEAKIDEALAALDQH